MVSICISLMTHDVGHLYVCLLPIHVSLLVKCLFKSLVIKKSSAVHFFIVEF